MKHFFFKTGLAFLLGLSSILFILALLTQLGTPTPVAYAAGPRYVAPGGSDSGNICTTLATPCATIQHAVDVADPEDVIKVAAGIYTGVNNYEGLSQTVYLSKSVTIQGGYPPAFSELPDPVANPTTLDAQGQGRVIYITGTITPTIEGLRITHGNAANLAGHPSGGDVGGGVYVITAAPIFSRNEIIDNTAEDGGGMYIYDSRATLFGNTIISNTANAGGGFVLYNTAHLDLITGKVTWDGPATVTHNIIMSNTATFPGGGGVIFYSDAVLTGNIIASNQANQGGGLHIGSSYPVFQNNQIFNNEAVEGGGLHSVISKIYFTNDILADNFSQEKGSGLYLERSPVYGQHLTIASNSGGDGSGIYMTHQSLAPPYSEMFLTNTIIASHTLGITLTAGSTASLESILWYGNGDNWAGSGTVTASNSYTGNPAFLDPAGGDYHLGPTSAAINKGVDAGVITDIDGEIRDTLPDLGADEWLGTVAALAISKHGPATASSGSAITYTLTVTNSGTAIATNLVITDTLPSGAHYVAGGTKVGNVVSWTVPALAANGGVIQKSFVVTATQTVTNSSYGVRADSGYQAKGLVPVKTLVESKEEDNVRTYLPLIIKN